MKKSTLTAILTAAVMTAGMSALPVQADLSSTDTFSYEASDSGVTITGLVSEKGPSKLVIPEEIDGKPVIGIGDWAFQGHSEIMDISVPDSVYEIGGNAFSGTRWYQAQAPGLVYAGNVVIAWKGRNRPDVIRLREGTTGIAWGAFGEGIGKMASYDDIRCYQTVPVMLPRSLKYIAYDLDSSDSWGRSWLEVGNLYYEGTAEEWSHVLTNGGDSGTAFTEKYPVYFEATEPDHEQGVTLPYIPGDVYGDGQVDIIDVITLNRSLLIGTSMLESEKAAADVNQNGVPDEADALMILRSIVGIEPLPEITPDVNLKNEFYQNGYALSEETADMLNNVELTPHLEYDIYEGEKSNGKVYQHIKLRDADVETLEAFAAAHFCEENTNAEKLYVTHQWIHYTNRYAYVGELWDTIVAKTYVDAIYNYQLGQCIQYNGGMAGMLAYMGYDVWMEGTPGVHWTTYVEIDGQVYNVECGNYGKNGEWQGFFSPVERGDDTAL